jgi:hypothetical protein
VSIGALAAAGLAIVLAACVTDRGLELSISVRNATDQPVKVTYE